MGGGKGIWWIRKSCWSGSFSSCNQSLFSWVYVQRPWSWLYKRFCIRGHGSSHWNNSFRAVRDSPSIFFSISVKEIPVSISCFSHNKHGIRWSRTRSRATWTTGVEDSDWISLLPATLRNIIKSHGKEQTGSKLALDKPQQGSLSLLSTTLKATWTMKNLCPPLKMVYWSWNFLPVTGLILLSLA